MVRQLSPKARDAAQRRVNRITVGVIAASVAGTLAIGAGIAVAAPPPKQNNKTDYGQKTKKKPATQPTKKNGSTPTNDKPESSSGDEQTTSGGS